MRKFRVVFILLALAAGFVLIKSAAKTRASSNKLAPQAWRKATLGDRVSLQAAGRGAPYINLSDGHELITPHQGAEDLVQALERNEARGLSLATADFDEDGLPDLISGYAGPHGGIITLLRGNVDSIYPNAPEAKQRKADGAFTDAPFLSPAGVFSVPAAPDFIGAGDFDADSHIDVVTAARGGDRLYMVAGDGHGGLKEAKAIALPGKVTAMTVGDMNRRDGLDDIVVGIAGADGAKVLVFEGPQGALTVQPEVFGLPDEATSLALGQLDNSDEIDLAVAAGHQLLIYHGRNRNLSLEKGEQAKVLPVRTTSRAFSCAIASIAIGDFTGSQKQSVALLAADGQVFALSRLEGGHQSSRANLVDSWKLERVCSVRSPSAAQLVRSGVSSLPGDDLVVIDSAGKQLKILTGNSKVTQRDRTEDASAAEGWSTVSLEAEHETLAIVPMRLNSDALSDLVILQAGYTTPAVATTAPVSTFTVANTNDSGAGSLRQAIISANANSGIDTINFNIPGAGVPTIKPLTDLPQVTSPVVIDGTTQSSGRVELDGSSLTPAFFYFGGLNITAGGSTVRGLVINRFHDVGGMELETNGGNIIEGNLIGTDVSGSTALGNGSRGLGVRCSNNLIGGTTAAARNIISGHLIVALNLTGVGIQLDSDSVGNTVSGNYIGTTISGGLALPNYTGVHIQSSSNNTIGGTNAGARNVISSNRDGVIIVEFGGNSSSNLVQGNFIGTNATGNAALGNILRGVFIMDSSDNTIGGTSAAARNVIADNDPGVNIFGFPQGSARNTIVQGNYIGTDVTGNVAIGNIAAGVTGGVIVSGGADTLIGGATVGAGNLISANQVGVRVVRSAGTLIRRNLIGTNASGTSSLGNQGEGLAISLSQNSQIGGITIESRNVISGNGGNGIGLGVFDNQGTFGGSDIVVRGNYIGTDINGTGPLGNGLCGIFVEVASTRYTIEGNIIAFNGTNGICIPDQTSQSGTPGLRISALSNSVFSNSLSGIDLGPAGMTPNDPGDNDVGANNLQNFPVLTSVTSINGVTRIIGALNSTPNTNFYVQFFSSAECTDSNPGQNQQVLTLPILYRTGANGTAPIDLTLQNTPVTGFVNATARDSLGNTSEFSCVQVNGAPSCTYSLGSTGRHFSSNGGTGTVSIMAGAACNWNAISNESFITITSGIDGTGKGSVGYQVAANTSTSSRTGVMTLAGIIFTVTQDAASPCDFSLSSSGQDFSSSAGTGSFTVFTQAGCTWSPVTDVGWITASRNGATISYFVGSNDSSARTGHITVQDQIYTITQMAGSVCTFMVSPASATFPVVGGSSSFTLTSGANCSWNAGANVPWISLPVSGVGGGVINYTVEPNSGPARSGSIFIEGQEFTIDQSASCSFSLSETSKSFNATGGAGSVTVNAGAGCTWQVNNNNPSLITITSPNIGTGTAMVTYTVASNAGPANRSGSLTIAGQTYSVVQAATFSDVPPSHLFYHEIGKLSARGVTVGCGGGNFCPNDFVTRQEMAAFIVRALGEFNPPTPGSQRYNDVPPSNVFYAFIDRLGVLQITVGCSMSPPLYCPASNVTREQMAALLIRAVGEFNPPLPATQRFNDVSPSNVFYNFIDRMAVLQITLGCSQSPPLYCPANAVTRGEMAAFLVRAFNL